MKKLLLIIMIGLCLLTIGCNKQVEMPVQETQEWYVDYNAISQEEFDMRYAFEFVKVFVQNMPNQDLEEEIGIEKYGIDDYWRVGDYYFFDEMKDMKTVFHNEAFKQYYYEKYSNEIVSYYYLIRKLQFDINGNLNSVNENDHFFYGISLISSKGEHSFVIGALGTFGDKFLSWRIYDIGKTKTARELIEFYARLDDFEVNSVLNENGDAIYYVTGIPKNLLYAIEVFPGATVSTYIWDQNDVIGVVVLAGEHKPENLEWCVLEQYEF